MFSEVPVPSLWPAYYVPNLSRPAAPCIERTTRCWILQRGWQGPWRGKRGLGGSMGDSRRDVRLHEANGTIPEECSYDHAVDHMGARAGG